MQLSEQQTIEAFERLIGVPPREADISVLKSIGPLTSESLGEYVWDHWMGEPDDPTQAQVTNTIVAMYDPPAAFATDIAAHLFATCDDADIAMDALADLVNAICIKSQLSLDALVDRLSDRKEAE